MLPTALTRIWKFQAGRGLDLGVFGLGSYYAFFAPKSGTRPLDYVYQSRWVGAVILSAWAAQGLGAWLKRTPLQSRWAERAGDPGWKSPRETAEGQIFIFTGWHALMSGIFFFTGITNLLPGLRESDHWSVPVLAILGVAVCIVPTVLVYRALLPPRTPDLRPWRRSPLAEFAGDQLFVFSYLVLTTTILGDGAMLQGTRPLNPESFLGWASTLLLFVPLLWLALAWMFVPFRMLLIIDELGTWRSRLAFLLSMSPLIAKYIVG